MLIQLLTIAGLYNDTFLIQCCTYLCTCRGSPLAIALIGAIVQSNTESRWKDVIDNLKKASYTLDAPIALDDENFQYNTLASSIELR